MIDLFTPIRGACGSKSTAVAHSHIAITWCLLLLDVTRPKDIPKQAALIGNRFPFVSMPSIVHFSALRPKTNLLKTVLTFCYCVHWSEGR